ncbi:MAG: BTAD domain-containing putative transcriptional regulator [Chloroflexota bacterium]
MNLNEVMNNAYDAFMHYVMQTPILLLHPDGRYRSIVIAKLISTDDANIFYYSLRSDDINLQAFIESLSHEMINQHPTFGRHLNMLPSEVYDDVEGNMELLTTTFARELHELSDQPFAFVLDEYDRSDDADDLHIFTEQLASVLPEHAHLVLNGRTLPRLPWVALIAKNQALMLRDDELIQRNFNGVTESDSYDLEVFALGPGTVKLNGEPINVWEGHLPRLLFFFALDKPVVTRSEICSAFWPDLATDQAVNVFHVTKRRLHKALGIDVLVHEDSHYRVNPDLNVYYDVLDFVETLMEGRDSETEEPFESWQKASKLYEGAFLMGHNDKWIVNRRQAFRAGYLEALTNMAEAWVGKDRKEIALKLYRQALDEDYSRQDIHRNIMQLYSELGRQSEAVAHYQELEKSFNDSGMVIENETSDMYGQVVG